MFGIVAQATLSAESQPMTLPDAVAMLFPEEYPTRSAVRKACRGGMIHVNGSKGSMSK